MGKKQSPYVQVVRVTAQDLDVAGPNLLMRVRSKGGKNVYFCFLPFSEIVRQCRLVGIEYAGPRSVDLGA